ncbi:hypothetical protein R1sor_023901 [Riccia sorocarpa]|uniref:Endonuclease/exonuclease/phosphatase domain-containing protein n=1 Tax=Riccia sorocarpa TaxID=122646 RepID=A0ABD3GS67_9MARC
MRLVVVTYNIRGLCARVARTKLKNTIRNYRLAPDILAVQEHKLRDRNLDFLTSFIWSQATIFYLPAADGTHAERNPNVIGGIGGFLLAINPAIAPLIVDNGWLPLHKGLWIHMDTTYGHKLGVATVYYAPHTSTERLKLEEAQTELRSWETERARWIQKHLDRKWEEDGDRCYKLFFNAINSRKKLVAIHALTDDAGNLHMDEDKMMDLAVHYFSGILQEPPLNPQQKEAANMLLARVQAQVTSDEKDNLQRNFTEQELRQAANLLGMHKCPGPDGIPLEFFLALWDTISPLLLKATTEGIHQGSLIPFFNKGLITLLQKDGDITQLKNKRPITAFLSSSALLAKVRSSAEALR